MENIIENNRLISHFMGTDINLPENWNKYSVYVIRHNGRYHNSWDWLMTVVEKIESMGYSVTIGTSFRKDKSQRTYCEIGTADLWNFELDAEPLVVFDEKNGNSKVINVWLTVIEFIKWYNKNGKGRN